MYFFKGTSPRTVIGRERGINISGVDFWHAVEFSRNGRFLRTHPHGLSSGRFPSVLLCSFFCSCVSDSTRPFPGSDFLGAFQVSAFAFPFPAIPTLPDPFGPDSQSERGCLPGCWAVPTSETLAESRPPKPIGVPSFRTRIPHFANAHENEPTTDRRSLCACCGMAARGPTGVGAHAGQPGEHYVAGKGVSTRCLEAPGRRTLGAMTTHACTQLWWAA